MPSSTVLVLQHVPHETLGTLELALAESGLRWRYLELFQQVPRELPLAEACGLIVLGGPMNVDQTETFPYLTREPTWIRQALDARLPVLGVCLGSQLLAKALGAEVRPNRVKEIGWYPLELLPAAADDPLFAGFSAEQTVFQWHGDTFDLPEGATHLARNTECENQAFRFGKSAWGLQFHIEVTGAMVHRWLDEPENRREVEGLDYIDPEEIRSRLFEALPRMDALGRDVLSRFAALCRERGHA